VNIEVKRYKYGWSVAWFGALFTWSLPGRKKTLTKETAS